MQTHLLLQILGRLLLGLEGSLVRLERLQAFTQHNRERRRESARACARKREGEKERARERGKERKSAREKEIEGGREGGRENKKTASAPETGSREQLGNAH